MQASLIIDGNGKNMGTISFEHENDGAKTVRFYKNTKWDENNAPVEYQTSVFESKDALLTSPQFKSLGK